LGLLGFQWDIGANTNVDTNGKLMGDLISCRHKNEFVLVNSEDVTLIDIDV
jgi:DNA-directed RNA polymerase subunit beta